MSNDDRQHQMDFILQQRAAFSSEMVELKNRLDQVGAGVEQLSSSVQQQGENIDKLTASVQALTDNVDSMREEMQDGFNNLILANEVTRKLAEDVARLAVGVSQRLAKHEQQPHETNTSDPS